MGPKENRQGECNLYSLQKNTVIFFWKVSYLCNCSVYQVGQIPLAYEQGYMRSNYSYSTVSLPANYPPTPNMSFHDTPPMFVKKSALSAASALQQAPLPVPP